MQDILAATGWQEVSFRTFWSKGQLSEFMSEVTPGRYRAYNTLQLDDAGFTRRLSQSKHRRELGYLCRSKLARALLAKSRDNMLLALELYNRPSLENRLDGFVLCFCTAWEQLLKAIIIERDGEGSIFRAASQRKAGIRETISLRECLALLWTADQSIRCNIEKITFFRDQAVHLLLPEVQGAVSRLFQSGVMNYSTQFEEFAKQSFISSSHRGLMTIVGDLRDPDHSFLRSRYGSDVGAEVHRMLKDLDDEITAVDDIEFSIPVGVRLVFAKSDEKGNALAISNADDGIEGLRKAIVVEKGVDPDRTHPYLQNAAIERINKLLYERYSEQQLEAALVSRGRSKRVSVNTRDFQAVAHKLKWKRSNNREHRKNVNPEFRKYSEIAIEAFIERVMTDTGFLARCRKSYSSYIKGKRQS